MPDSTDIGYLDQHYATLDPDSCAMQIIEKSAPHWTLLQIREHLNSFLFRKNEEVRRTVRDLSGGEKARLSLGQIAATTPKLLILDEITNNIDLETREHVAQVLQEYPGAIILISHDEAFANEIAASESILSLAL